MYVQILRASFIICELCILGGHNPWMYATFVSPVVFCGICLMYKLGWWERVCKRKNGQGNVEDNVGRENEHTYVMQPYIIGADDVSIPVVSGNQRLPIEPERIDEHSLCFVNEMNDMNDGRKEDTRCLSLPSQYFVMGNCLSDWLLVIILYV